MRTGKELRAEEMNMVNGGLIIVYDPFIKVYTDDKAKDLARFKFKKNFIEQLAKAVDFAEEHHVSKKVEVLISEDEWDFLAEHC